MPDKLLIAAKNLGALAMPKACERCFWVKTHFDGEFAVQHLPESLYLA